MDISARILVVDTEALVLDMVRTALAARGYDVRTAADCFTALEIADGPQAIDLVLCEVNMPALHGLELVRRIRNANSAVRALLMSGYTESPLPVALPFIEKPFRAQELLRAVERLLSVPAG